METAKLPPVNNTLKKLISDHCKWDINQARNEKEAYELLNIIDFKRSGIYTTSPGKSGVTFSIHAYLAELVETAHKISECLPEMGTRRIMSIAHSNHKGSLLDTLQRMLDIAIKAKFVTDETGLKLQMDVYDIRDFWVINEDSDSESLDLIAIDGDQVKFGSGDGYHRALHLGSESPTISLANPNFAKAFKEAYQKAQHERIF